jgi:hypothetical protein
VRSPFFSILHLPIRVLIKSRSFKVLGNFTIVGKKQSKHLLTLGYSRVLADPLDLSRGFWQLEEVLEALMGCE